MLNIILIVLLWSFLLWNVEHSMWKTIYMSDVEFSAIIWSPLYAQGSGCSVC